MTKDAGSRSPNFHVAVDVCGISGPDGNFVALHAYVDHSATDLVSFVIKSLANEAQHLHQPTYNVVLHAHSQ